MNLEAMAVTMIIVAALVANKTEPPFLERGRPVLNTFPFIALTYFRVKDSSGN